MLNLIWGLFHFKRQNPNWSKRERGILGIRAGELVLDVPTNKFSQFDMDRIYKS